MSNKTPHNPLSSKYLNETKHSEYRNIEIKIKGF